MAQEDMSMWVNNVEGLYNEKIELFERWIEQGDAWSEVDAEREALAVTAHFAEAIEAMEGVDETFSKAEIHAAAKELLSEFEDYREGAFKAAIETVTRTPKPEALKLKPGDIEHAKKYEELARIIGIDHLKSLIPASPERIRKALERGDKYLNTIPLRKWDRATQGIPTQRLSLSEKVSVLKHVATWHYA